MVTIKRKIISNYCGDNYEDFDLKTQTEIRFLGILIIKKEWIMPKREIARMQVN